jgi:hypothetical protein
MRPGTLRVRAPGSSGSPSLASAATVFRRGRPAFLPSVWEESDSRWALLGDLEALGFIALAMVNHAGLRICVRNGERGKGKTREGMKERVGIRKQKNWEMNWSLDSEKVKGKK